MRWEGTNVRQQRVNTGKLGMLREAAFLDLPARQQKQYPFLAKPEVKEKEELFGNKNWRPIY